jgi:hypothetical protein
LAQVIKQILCQKQFKQDWLRVVSEIAVRVFVIMVIMIKMVNMVIVVFMVVMVIMIIVIDMVIRVNIVYLVSWLL